MQRLGTLQGVGTLRVDDVDFHPIGYRLSVWREDSGWLSAAGTLTGGPDAFKAATKWGDGILFLADRRTVTVLIRRIDNIGTRAEVRVSGPVHEI
jgi:hypothetical protein